MTTPELEEEIELEDDPEEPLKVSTLIQWQRQHRKTLRKKFGIDIIPEEDPV